MGRALKDYFKGWNAFEYTFLCIGLILPVTLGLIFGSGPWEIIGGTLQIVVAISFAKGKIEGYFLQFLSLGVYAYITWIYKLYGELIVQVMINLPIAITGICSWAKNKRKDRIDGQVVVVGHVKNLELTLLLVSQAAMGVGYYFLLRFFGTQQVLASTISLTFSIVTGYLLMRRSRRNMVFSVISDITSAVVWLLVVLSGQKAAIVMLVMEIMYTIIDIHGIREWSNLKKHQRKPRKKHVLPPNEKEQDD